MPADVLELRKLVLRESLGRKEIERSCVGILQNGIDNRQVVTDGLSGGSRSNYDDVFAPSDALGRLSLVGVESLHSFIPVGFGEFGAHPGGHGNPFGLAGRDMPNGCDLMELAGGGESFNRLSQANERNM
jgi:hypothetical protein